MSKSKKNYPDPMEVVNEFGADAVRWVALPLSLSVHLLKLYQNVPC